MCGQEEVEEEDGICPEDAIEDGEEQEDAGDEEFEYVFGGKRNERLSQIVPNLEKKIDRGCEQSHLCKAWWSQGGFYRGGEVDKKETQVRVVSTVKGLCYVCGKVLALMPKNCNS